MTVQFQEIPIGDCFEFRGRRYKKVAISMAHDEDRHGNVFLDYTEVVPDRDGQPAKNKPSWPTPRRFQAAAAC